LQRWNGHSEIKPTKDIEFFFPFCSVLVAGGIVVTNGWNERRHKNNTMDDDFNRNRQCICKISYSILVSFLGCFIVSLFFCFSFKLSFLLILFRFFLSSLSLIISYPLKFLFSVQIVIWQSGLKRFPLYSMRIVVGETWKTGERNIIHAFFRPVFDKSFRFQWKRKMKADNQRHCLLI